MRLQEGCGLRLCGAWSGSQRHPRSPLRGSVAPEEGGSLGSLEGGRLIEGLSFLLVCVCVCVCVCVFAISWAALAAYGGSQARGLIGAVSAGLRQSHSNVGSEPRLQPTPQLTAMPDP